MLDQQAIAEPAPVVTPQAVVEAPAAGTQTVQVAGELDAFADAPSPVKWGAHLLVLGAEVATILFLVAEAVLADNHLAASWVPMAVALVGAHQATSSADALRGR